MKTNISVMAGIILFIFTGCGSNGQTNPETNNSSIIAEKKHEGEPVQLTKDEFLKHVMNYEKNTEEWIYEGDIPSFIDFYADWCVPCRITSPIIEELAKEYAGEVQFYKIDTEAEQELSAVFGIQSIPTFLLVPVKGKPYLTSGIASTPEETKQMFKDQINQYLLNKQL
jgi:thioredoxin